MSRPAAPVLTVRSGRSHGSFAAGREVIVGSDLRADLRVAHPLVARAHLVLRYDQDKWIAVDNDSQNGIYVNGKRVSTVEIQDGQTINIGKPDGPRITFEVGHHRGIVGLLPPTETLRPLTLPPGPPGSAPASGPPPEPPPSRPQPAPPPADPGAGPRPRHPRRPPPPTQPPTVARVPHLRPDGAQRSTAIPPVVSLRA